MIAVEAARPVLIGGMPAARMGDIVVEAGTPNTVAIGCPNVMIGG